MPASFAGTITWVWLALITLTGASWWLGTGSAGSRGSSAVILVVALLKARLVLLHFMEVKRAPLALRLACEAWVAATGALLLGLDALA